MLPLRLLHIPVCPPSHIPHSPPTLYLTQCLACSIMIVCPSNSGRSERALGAGRVVVIDLTVRGLDRVERCCVRHDRSLTPQLGRCEAPRWRVRAMGFTLSSDRTADGPSSVWCQGRLPEGLSPSPGSMGLWRHSCSPAWCETGVPPQDFPRSRGSRCCGALGSRTRQSRIPSPGLGHRTRPTRLSAAPTRQRRGPLSASQSSAFGKYLPAPSRVTRCLRSRRYPSTLNTSFRGFCAAEPPRRGASRLANSTPVRPGNSRTPLRIMDVVSPRTVLLMFASATGSTSRTIDSKRRRTSAVFACASLARRRSQAKRPASLYETGFEFLDLIGASCASLHKE